MSGPAETPDKKNSRLSHCHSKDVNDISDLVGFQCHGVLPSGDHRRGKNDVEDSSQSTGVLEFFTTSTSCGSKSHAGKGEVQQQD